MQFSAEFIQKVVNDPAHAEQIRDSKQFMQAVMRRSTTEPGFRQQLLDSPKEALASQYQQVFGKAIEGGFPVDVRFVEPTSDLTLVLPPVIDPEAELSDEEMAAVAGGITPTVLLVVSYAGGVGVSIGVVWAVDKLTS
jgi:hypothetical protein